MAKRKKRQQEEELLVDLTATREQTQDFLERNQKSIVGGLLLAALLVGGFFAYKYLYKAPREKEALEQMYRAEMEFQRDSFALALNGPQDYPGFEQIMSDYKGTKAANLARYYAGISHLRTGNFQAAIDNLESFRAKGMVSPSMKNGALGDAYSELNNFDQALSYYEKAIGGKGNGFSTPYYLWKAGLLAQKQGDNAKAQKYFERIKKEYPNSTQGQDIDRYLSAQ